jgi:hypothetical protein
MPATCSPVPGCLCPLWMWTPSRCATPALLTWWSTSGWVVGAVRVGEEAGCWAGAVGVWGRCVCVCFGGGGVLGWYCAPVLFAGLRM